MTANVSFVEFQSASSTVNVSHVQFDTLASTTDVRVSWVQFNTRASVSVGGDDAPFVIYERYRKRRGKYRLEYEDEELERLVRKVYHGITDEDAPEYLVERIAESVKDQIAHQPEVSFADKPTDFTYLNEWITANRRLIEHLIRVRIEEEEEEALMLLM